MTPYALRSMPSPVHVAAPLCSAVHVVHAVAFVRFGCKDSYTPCWLYVMSLHDAMQHGKTSFWHHLADMLSATSAAGRAARPAVPAGVSVGASAAAAAGAGGPVAAAGCAGAAQRPARALPLKDPLPAQRAPFAAALWRRSCTTAFQTPWSAPMVAEAHYELQHSCNIASMA